MSMRLVAPSSVSIQQVTPWAMTSCLACLRCFWGPSLAGTHTVLFSGYIVIGTFALFLGAVFGGNHLLASPVDAAR